MSGHAAVPPVVPPAVLTQMKVHYTYVAACDSMITVHT